MTDHGDRRSDIEPEQLQQNRTFARDRRIVLCRHAPEPPHPSRRIRNLSRPTVQLGSTVALTGCGGPLSTLSTAGPSADAIATLWWVMLAGSAATFVLVLGLFALVILRPGWGSSVSPARWIVLGGLVLPGVVLTPLVAYALITGERLLPLPGVARQRIEAEGRQWNWTFRYPGEGGVQTVNVLHLPAGVSVDIAVSGFDVIHSFWIPRFAGKIDAVPGHVNVLRIQADEPGRYEGQCSEFCGIGHALMRFAVIVHPAKDFSAAVAQAAASSPASARVKE
jgi:cytochrome c oxidase subunit 2